MLYENKADKIILLLDSLALRRESIRSLLAPWSANVECDFLVMSPDDIPGIESSREKVKLVLLVVGSLSLSLRDQQDVMGQIKEFFPQAPCAVLSDSREPDEAVQAARAGMQAFLTTAMQPETVSQTLAFVLSGGSYFPREALLAPRAATSTSAYVQAGRGGDLAQAGLTLRQCEVVERLRHGKSNKLIARELNMQEATVKVHVRQIMRKLGAVNRTQVALLAQVSATMTNSPVEDDISGIPPAAILAQPSKPSAVGLSHDIGS